MAHPRSLVRGPQAPVCPAASACSPWEAASAARTRFIAASATPAMGRERWPQVHGRRTHLGRARQVDPGAGHPCRVGAAAPGRRRPGDVETLAALAAALSGPRLNADIVDAAEQVAVLLTIE